MRVIRAEVTEGHPDYPALSVIRDEIATRAGGLPALKEKFPLLVRDAVDFLLDSVRTARTRVTELDNVEKTFIGLKLEHFVRDMLDVPKGLRDLHINGTDVDIKNTVNDTWTIPPETYRASEPCLLMAVDDIKSECWLGLMLAKLEYLSGGKGNRDEKRSVVSAGFDNILWLAKGEPFPKSYFDGINMDRFREIRKIKHGNPRAAQFFRENLRRIVHRRVVESLLYDQLDPMKRLRANGGCPDQLMPEGIAIFIGTFTADRELASQAGIVSLGRDEVVAVKPQTEAEWKLLKDTGAITSAEWTV